MDQPLVFTPLYGGARIVLLLIIILSRRAKRHGGAFRGGVVGAIYEWENKDKQNALDVIVDGQSSRDPAGIPGWRLAAARIAEREPQQAVN